jgi:hypothetical protein
VIGLQRAVSKNKGGIIYAKKHAEKGEKVDSS